MNKQNLTKLLATLSIPFMIGLSSCSNRVEYHEDNLPGYEQYRVNILRVDSPNSVTGYAYDMWIRGDSTSNPFIRACDHNGDTISEKFTYYMSQDKSLVDINPDDINNILRLTLEKNKE